MIFPEIFDGHVMGFFTDREVGIDVRGITGVTPYLPIQTHSDKVQVLGDDLTPREADAVITSRREVMIGVQTADCVPILLYDKTNRAIGAVHAGWRGTAAGILKKTLAAMAGNFGTKPEDVLLAMGPSIMGACYVVGQEVVDAMMQGVGPGDYHEVSGGMNHIDLHRANLKQALEQGIAMRGISMSDECTHCMPETYFSYRYAPGAGRQGGFIMMP